jgi:predicted glycosyltransferase involved in capsule biosynthesis
MLSQIAGYVENFCGEEDTTLMGVIKLLAEYHQLKANHLYDRLSSLEDEELS